MYAQFSMKQFQFQEIVIILNLERQQVVTFIENKPKIINFKKAVFHVSFDPKIQKLSSHRPEGIIQLTNIKKELKSYDMIYKTHKQSHGIIIKMRMMMKPYVLRQITIGQGDEQMRTKKQKKPQKQNAILNNFYTIVFYIIIYIIFMDRIQQQLNIISLFSQIQNYQIQNIMQPKSKTLSQGQLIYHNEEQLDRYSHSNYGSQIAPVLSKNLQKIQKNIVKDLKYLKSKLLIKQQQQAQQQRRRKQIQKLTIKLNKSQQKRDNELRQKQKNIQLGNKSKQFVVKQRLDQLKKVQSQIIQFKRKQQQQKQKQKQSVYFQKQSRVSMSEQSISSSRLQRSLSDIQRIRENISQTIKQISSEKKKSQLQQKQKLWSVPKLQKQRYNSQNIIRNTSYQQAQNLKKQKLKLMLQLQFHKKVSLQNRQNKSSLPTLKYNYIQKIAHNPQYSSRQYLKPNYSQGNYN